MHPRILIVDDDVDDQFISVRALRQAMPQGGTLNCASSGNEAVAYMIGEGQFADRTRYPFPTLLITDLNMADGDGLAVLAFMHGNPGWSVVPRIVFSSSDNEDDVRTAFLLGASAYHLKSVDPRHNETCLSGILRYWATSLVPPVDEQGRLLVTAIAGTRGERFPPPPDSGERMQRP
jgi:CheY-like chemotaxis protein